MPASFDPLRHAAAWVATDWRFFLAVIAIGAAPGVLGALLLTNAATIVSGLLALYLQLLVTARTLDAAGAMPADYSRHHATDRRFPSALLASFLSIVAIATALTLLIVPGILLYGLWSLWMPALLAERLRVTEALRRSWWLVRPRPGGVLLSTLWLGLVWTGLLAIPVTAALLDWGDRPMGVVAELAVTTAQLFGAAVYAHLFIQCRERAGDGETMNHAA